jgi:transposase
MATPHARSRKVRESLWGRFGSWLGQTLRRERAADPQRAEDERRKRGGQLGENLDVDSCGVDVDGVAQG